MKDDRYEVIPSNEDWAVACVTDLDRTEDEVIAHFAWLRDAHLFADLLNTIHKNTGARL